MSSPAVTAPRVPSAVARAAAALRVVYFQRLPTYICYSIEKSFDAMRERLPADVRPEVFVAKYPSRGLWRRLYSLVEAALHQGDVNHITGDIHFVAYLLRKRRTVLTIHDIGFLNRPSRLQRLVLRWLWLTLPEKRVAVLTTVSDFTRGQLLEVLRCDPDKVRVVPTVISPLFRRIDKPFDRARPTILNVGTTINKNLPRLLQALAGIPCRLVVIGKLSAEQRALLDGSGVEWEGHFDISEDALLEQYARADLVAFCSTYEGFGMPILEANTVGRPVVTSNVTSMPEVAGDAACIVDPTDVAAIRAGILRVIEDDAYRARLVDAGFRNAQRFSPERVAEQYAQIYRELAGV